MGGHKGHGHVSLCWALFVVRAQQMGAVVL